MLKILYALLPVLMVLSIGIIQAEAYDGSIKIDTDKSQYFEGEQVVISGFIYNAEPIENEVVKIFIKDLLTDEILQEDSTTINSDSEFFKDTDEKIWKFSYIIDTANPILEPRTRYLIDAMYDDVSDDIDFDFNIPLAQQSSGIPEALKNSNDQKIVDISERLESLETKNNDLLKENEALKDQISKLNDRIDGLMLVVQEQINTMMKFFQ